MSHTTEYVLSFRCVALLYILYGIQLLKLNDH